MNENSAVYSVFGSVSPAGDATGVEYVWLRNSLFPHRFDIRSDCRPNAGGAPLLATTAWSYCPPVGVGLHDGIAPGGALFQPCWPLTEPVAKPSKFVVTVSATAT